MIRVDLEPSREIERKVSVLLSGLPEVVAAINEETGESVVAAAQRFLLDNDSIVTGELFNSIDYEVSPDGMGVSVGSRSPYAPFVEFGSAPHFPPLEAIRNWCRLRGIDERYAYPIALKIAEVGIEEKPFLYPAYELEKRLYVARVRDAFRDYLKGILKPR